MAGDLCGNNFNVSKDLGKMRFSPLTFFAAVFFSLSLSGVSFAKEKAVAPPYNVKERLEFDVSYFGVNGGTAVLEVRGIEKVSERDTYHIVSTAKSNEFFSKIYKVRDIIETYIDTKEYYPLRMKIDQHEGEHKEKSDILFDQDNNKAILLKEHNRKTVYNIVGRVQDSLSSLFYVRMQDLKVGKDIVFDAYASRKSWQLVIKVLKKETIKVAAGTFDTVLIKPLLKFNDVFINKGDVYIWLSDDDRKIPVKLKSKIIIGAFTAELVSQEKGLVSKK
jgi:hypothetical protein